jgi:hypothetical protein
MATQRERLSALSHCFKIFYKAAMLHVYRISRFATTRGALPLYRITTRGETLTCAPTPSTINKSFTYRKFSCFTSRPTGSMASSTGQGVARGLSLDVVDIKNPKELNFILGHGNDLLGV